MHLEPHAPVRPIYIDLDIGNDDDLNEPVAGAPRPPRPPPPDEPDEEETLEWAMEQLAMADAEEELISARAHEDALLASLEECGVDEDDWPCRPSEP